MMNRMDPASTAQPHQRIVARIEAVLSLYGATFAVPGIVRGAPSVSDRAWLAAALFLFAVTAYVGAGMPRVIRN